MIVYTIGRKYRSNSLRSNINWFGGLLIYISYCKNLKQFFLFCVNYIGLNSLKESRWVVKIASRELSYDPNRKEPNSPFSPHYLTFLNLKLLLTIRLCLSYKTKRHVNKIAASPRLMQTNLFVHHCLWTEGAARLVATVVVLAVVVTLFLVVSDNTLYLDHV